MGDAEHAGAAVDEGSGSGQCVSESGGKRNDCGSLLQGE